MKRDEIEYSRKYYIKNKERIDRRNKEYYKNNREKILLQQKIRFSAPEQKNRKRELDNKRHRINKEIVIKAYGGKCVCCGERIIEFLTIDHLDGGGQKHRESLGSKYSSVQLYKWLIRNDFPENFQLLCFNCNITKGLYGVCPHNK